jgi:hypothetical protein
MIYLENDKTNKLIFAETLPRNFVFYLKHKQNRNEYSIAALNDLVVNTETFIHINNLDAGEYIYKLLVDGIVYETGIAKVISSNIPTVKMLERDIVGKKFKMLKKE